MQSLGYWKKGKGRGRGRGKGRGRGQKGEGGYWQHWICLREKPFNSIKCTFRLHELTYFQQGKETNRFLCQIKIPFLSLFFLDAEAEKDSTVFQSYICWHWTEKGDLVTQMLNIWKLFLYLWTQATRVFNVFFSHLTVFPSVNSYLMLVSLNLLFCIYLFKKDFLRIWKRGR